MNFDSFLSAPRWEILQILAQNPSSPLELAAKLGTTVAYMSQQLKLLDAAALITKTKTGATEKGKPRSVYSLSHDFSYLVVLYPFLASRRLISATPHHRAILSLWFIEDLSLHSSYEKVYHFLEGHFSSLDGVFVDTRTPKFILVGDVKKLRPLVSPLLSRLTPKVLCEYCSRSQFVKFDDEQVLPLFDPSNLKGILKGGMQVS